jgi:hypothetical protein
VFEFIRTSADLGVLDPYILAVLAGIVVCSVLIYKLLPARQPRQPAGRKASQNGPKPAKRTLTTRTGSQPANLAAVATGTQPVTQRTSAGYDLTRLRTIIDTGMSCSDKISSAHAGATVKIDAAEHALNRAVLDIKDVWQQPAHGGDASDANLTTVAAMTAPAAGPPAQRNTQIAA